LEHLHDTRRERAGKRANQWTLESDAEMGIDVCLSLEEVAKKIVKSTEKIKAEVSKTDKYFELIHRMDKYLTAKEK